MAASFLIDIDHVLETKMGARARFVPRVLRNLLKRIACQDEFNEFLSKEGDTVGVPWLIDAVQHLQITLRVVGKENLPSDADGRRFTFVSNHPLGGLDGISIGSVIGEAYGGRIRYLVNDLLMNLPGLAPLCVPINKTGAQSRDLPRLVAETFASNAHVIMFPAGLCSRKIGGSIQDLPWQKTFVKKSIETQRDIVPLFFEGRNSERFYRTAAWRKRLHIPFNLEMLMLPSEMFRQRGAHLTLHIGRPIAWQELAAHKGTVVETAQWVRAQCYAMR